MKTKTDSSPMVRRRSGGGAIYQRKFKRLAQLVSIYMGKSLNGGQNNAVHYFLNSMVFQNKHNDSTTKTPEVPVVAA